MCCVNGCNGPCMGEGVDKFCLIPGNVLLGAGGVAAAIGGFFSGGIQGNGIGIAGLVLLGLEITEIIRKKYNWKYIRMGHNMARANDINEEGKEIAIKIGKTAYKVTMAVDALAAENEKERKDLEDIDHRSQVELDKLEKGATSLKDKSDALGKVTDWLQKNLETMNETLKGLNTLQENAHETADQAEEKLAKLQKHATKADKQIDRLKGNNQELGGLIETLQSVMKNLNEQIGTAKANMEQRAAQIAQFESQIEGMESDAKKHEEQMEKLAEQIKELNKAEKMLKDFRQEVDGAEKSVGEMVEDELVNAHQMAVALRFKFKNSLKEIIATTETLIKAKNKQKKKKQAEVDMVKMLENQVADLKANLASFEALEQNLEREIDELEKSKPEDAKFGTLEDLNEAVGDYMDKLAVSEGTRGVLQDLHKRTDLIIKGVLTAFPKGALLATEIYRAARPFMMKAGPAKSSEEGEESAGSAESGHDVENPED